MRAMLAHAGDGSVQVAFWPFLMLAAAQRHNALYTFATIQPTIPIMLASKSRLTPVSLSKFKLMLCDCFVAVKKLELLDKLTPRRLRPPRPLCLHPRAPTDHDSL